MLGASCFIASNHELFEQACAETYWESYQDSNSRFVLLYFQMLTRHFDNPAFDFDN